MSAYLKETSISFIFIICVFGLLIRSVSPRTRRESNDRIVSELMNWGLNIRPYMDRGLF